MSGVKLSAGLLVAGWLATALASTDPDIDAGVAAYDAGTYDEALSRFDAAKERLGDRPEISFNRGLALLRNGDAEASRTGFERATEAEDTDLRGSAHYELGNLSFEAEAWDAAIASYIECLKANPLHANAKWNLELALQEKKEQEEKEEEEKEDEEKEDGEDGEDGEEKPEDKENEPGEDEETPEDKEDEPGEEDEEKPEDEPESGEDEPGEDEPGEDKPGEDEPDEQKPEDKKDEPGDQEQPGEDEPKPEPEQQPAEPKPIDKMDLDRALEKLDEQDPFTLEKPSGGYVQPEKDW